MAKFLQGFLKLATADIANQYAIPVKSLTGYCVSKYGSSKTALLNKLAVDYLKLSPGNKILEIGYGRGDGIKECLQKIEENGLICGIERSHYMEETTRKRFILELTEGSNISLDRCIDLRILPYPSDLFNSIYHVDAFYFIHQERLPEVCKELFRVLLPGGKMVCGMEFKRLEKLTKWGILNRSQWDAMRYLSCLEPIGFTDVQVNYVDDPSGRQFQIIIAKKPEADEVYFDPEAQMAHLERQVKREMLMVELRKSGRIPTKEDLKIMREDIEK